MSERKTLTITEIGQIVSGDRKDGKGKWQSLPFKAKDGDKELSYSTFRTSLFDAIKQGATIQAEVEIQPYDYEGETRYNRKVVQIYVDGQPIGGQKQGYRGKSPEELEQQAKLMILAYAKDLAVAQLIPLESILSQADSFYLWLKNGKPDVKKEVETVSASTEETFTDVTQAAIRDLTQFKGLMASKKIGTGDVLTILSIGKLREIKDFDSAWGKVKEAKGL